MPLERNPYVVLGLRPTATQEEIDRAYRLLLERYRRESMHQDEGTDPKILALAEAHELLSDPTQRAAYDRMQRRRIIAPTDVAFKRQLQEADLEKHLTSARRCVRNRAFPGAVEACNAALSVEPHCAEAHFLKGDALAALGRKEEAMRAYGTGLLYDAKNTVYTDRYYDLYHQLRKHTGKPFAGRGGPGWVALFAGVWVLVVILCLVLEYLALPAFSVWCVAVVALAALACTSSYVSVGVAFGLGLLLAVVGAAVVRRFAVWASSASADSTIAAVGNHAIVALVLLWVMSGWLRYTGNAERVRKFLMG